ncbi:MAG: phosphodiester glycosidase family protein [Muribaculaceae bacterium]|nr:phosphodiester glycosidase family protein [Muribaculaceae bacterium]
MKKIFVTLFALSFIALGANASTQWNIQGSTYRVDTLSHFYSGPGTTLTTLALSGPSTLKVFYTTTDLTNQYVDIRAVKGQDKVLKVETVSSMAESRSKNGVNYISGVNADFFSTATPMYPIGTVMVDGEPYYTNNSESWKAFGITADKVPFLGSSSINAIVKSANAGQASLTSYNTPRYSDYLTLYTPRIGTTTGTNIYGAEVALEPVNGAKIEVGKTIKMRVVSAPVDKVGNMTIPTDGFVLSGNGASALYVNKLVAGEEIEFTATVAFNNSDAGNITQVVGGQPMILSDGVVLDTQGAIDHLVGLHPRTAVGYSADKKNLVMMVVDGRTSQSIGVTSRQLADIMHNTGCTEAMNFDGGGSSEIYSRTFGIVNYPSGGMERAVSDGLFVTTSAPEDKAIAQIRFRDASKSLPKYGYFTPTIYGYNQYGVLVDTNITDFKLSAPSSLGTVSSDGKSLFCNGEGSHALTVSYNGMTSTIPVAVTSGNVSFRLTEAIEDGHNGYVTEVYSEILGEKFILDNQALTWWSDDATIATVEPITGKILGRANGTTNIHGKVDNFEGVLKVNVQLPEKFVMPIDQNPDPATWTFNQVGGTINETKALENGFTINYSGKAGRGPYLKMTKEITLWSLPDSIRIRINPNGAPVQNVLYSLRANGKEVANTKVTPTAIASDKVNVISLATRDWCDAADRMNYPITFNYLTLGMGTSTTGQVYNVEIPGIELVYNALDPSGVESVIAANSKLIVYPNPVKAGEIVTLSGVETGIAKVYSVGGSLIKQVALTAEAGNATFTTEGLTPGIYFIFHKTGTHKLIVL